MGKIIGYKCQDCGYKFTAFLGVGFSFPAVYAETVEKMKSGKLGKDAQQFFKDHPDGSVNCENVLFQCDQCHKYFCDKDLSMYVPKGGVTMPPKTGRWSVAMPFEGAEYITKEDLDKYFEPYKRFDHRCKECGGKLSFAADDISEHIQMEIECPICHGRMKLKLEDLGYWD